MCFLELYLDAAFRVLRKFDVVERPVGFPADFDRDERAATGTRIRLRYEVLVEMHPRPRIFRPKARVACVAFPIFSDGESTCPQSQPKNRRPSEPLSSTR